MVFIHLFGCGEFCALSKEDFDNVVVINSVFCPILNLGTVNGYLEGGCNKGVLLACNLLGNLLVQAMAHGLVSGISEARELVRKSFPVKTYLPRGNKSDYDAYLDKYLRLIDRK